METTKKKNKRKSSFGKRMWLELNKIAKERFGEFGFSTLNEDEMRASIEMACSNLKK